MGFPLTCLSLDILLREKAEHLVTNTTLPEIIPWTGGVTFTDLQKQSGAMGRLMEKQFILRSPNASWKIDSGVSVNGLIVRWTISVDLDGEVRATASPFGAMESEVSRASLLEALGCHPRVLGSVGPLEPIFSDDEQRARAWFGKLGFEPQTMLVSAHRARALRRELAAALGPEQP